MNSMCKTVTYNGYYQYCVLYSAYLQEGQLRIMTIDMNSTVISVGNMTFPNPIVSPEATAVEITTQLSTPSNSQAKTTAIEPSPLNTINRTTTTITATCTTSVNFDNIPQHSSTSGIIPNGYKNLNWNNAEYINVSTILTTSGYTNGVRSQPFVLHNPTGDNVTITTANGTRFSFDSLYLTSAWRDFLNITLNTIRAGSTTSSQTYTAMTSTASRIRCSICTDIDTITLQADDGIPHTNWTQNGTQFVIDNLCISFGH